LVIERTATTSRIHGPHGRDKMSSDRNAVCIKYGEVKDIKDYLWRCVRSQDSEQADRARAPQPSPPDGDLVSPVLDL